MPLRDQLQSFVCIFSVFFCQMAFAFRGLSSVELQAVACFFKGRKPEAPTPFEATECQPRLNKGSPGFVYLMTGATVWQRRLRHPQSSPPEIRFPANF